MQNKSKLIIFLLSLIIIVFLIVGFMYFFLNNSKTKGGNNNLANDLQQNKQNPNTSDQTNQTNTNVANVSKDKPSTITIDPNNPNVLTYTSYKLGVQFSYLKDGEFGLAPFKPIEIGNRISFVANDAIISPEYIRIFQQLQSESVEQTLRRVLPEQFNSKYCKLFSSDYDKSHLNYFIWDARLPLSKRGSDAGPTEETDLLNVCNPSMNLNFKTDSAFPGVIYYMNYSTQSPTFFADVNHTKSWVQSVHLIEK